MDLKLKKTETNTSANTKKIGIIGGGPAGLVSAMILAKEGHEITLFEKEEWPVQKVCGEGIMPNGVEILTEFNILEKGDLKDKEFNWFNGVTYINKKNQKITGHFRKNDGLAIKREKLILILLEKIKKNKNIHLKPLHVVLNVVSRESGIIEVLDKKSDELSHYQFDFVLGCDGLNSHLRRSLQVETKSITSLHRLAVRAYYPIAPWSRQVEVYWGNGIEAYITPISQNEINLLVTWDKNIPFLKNNSNLFVHLLEQFPELKEKIGGTEPSQINTMGGFGKASGKISTGPFFFIGDALVFYDGITGEGLSLAFEEAKLFSQFLKLNKSIYWYYFKINILIFKLKTITRLALLCSYHLKLQNGFFKILMRYPKIFDTILAINTF